MYKLCSSSPTLMVSPEIQTQPQHTTKEFYTLSSTPQQLQHHLQQQQQHHQQQQQQQHQAIRSPTSFSSYDNDSLKDFEISNSNSNISNQRINNSTPQQQQQQQQQTPLTPKSSSSSSLTINTNNNSNNNNMQNTPQKQKHTNKVPYDRSKTFIFSLKYFL